MPDWFTALTGLPDDRPETVRAGIAAEGPWLVLPGGRRLHAGRLTLPALGEVPRPPPGRPRLREVVADVQALHADPAQAGAVFLVASQVNLLEMVGPQVAPEDGIARYAFDRTQGPACAIACAAGTIWRNYLVPLAGQRGQTAGRQIDTLADLQAALGGGLWDTRNGYVIPRPGALPRIAAAIAGREAALRDLVRVGWQQDTEVTLPGAGQRVSQIYASALPLAYAGGAEADWEPFARLVLEAAYEAAIRLAAPAGRLFLTRLGGGAFGNPAAWIEAAILAAARRSPADIDLVMVSHRAPDPANARLAAALSD